MAQIYLQNYSSQFKRKLYFIYILYSIRFYVMIQNYCKIYFYTLLSKFPSSWRSSKWSQSQLFTKGIQTFKLTYELAGTELTWNRDWAKHQSQRLLVFLWFSPNRDRGTWKGGMKGWELGLSLVPISQLTPRQASPKSPNLDEGKGGKWDSKKSQNEKRKCGGSACCQQGRLELGVIWESVNCEWRIVK